METKNKENRSHGLQILAIHNTSLKVASESFKMENQRYAYTKTREESLRIFGPLDLISNNDVKLRMSPLKILRGWIGDDFISYWGEKLKKDLP